MRSPAKTRRHLTRSRIALRCPRGCVVHKHNEKESHGELLDRTRLVSKQQQHRKAVMRSGGQSMIRVEKKSGEWNCSCGQWSGRADLELCGPGCDQRHLAAMVAAGIGVVSGAMNLLAAVLIWSRNDEIWLTVRRFGSISTCSRNNMSCCCWYEHF